MWGGCAKATAEKPGQGGNIEEREAFIRRKRVAVKEQGVQQDRFERPVRIWVGLSFPRDIETVAEAYAFLVDWPEPKRNGAHSPALEACRAALTREGEARTAQAAFMTFARRARIIAPIPRLPSVQTSLGAPRRVPA